MIPFQYIAMISAIIIVYIIYISVELKWRDDQYGLEKVRGSVGFTNIDNEEAILNMTQEELDKIRDSRKKKVEKFVSNPASLDYNMGNYSNILLNKKVKNIPLKKNIYTSFGSQNPLNTKIPIDSLQNNATTVDGSPNSPRSMAIFKYNFCKPECCPATYSCSGGCICQTEKQKDFINKRGFNRTITDSL